MSLSAKETLNGVVYTPPALATYLADRLVHYYRRARHLPSPEFGVRPVSVLDPACGQGELLEAVARAFADQRATPTPQRTLGARHDLVLAGTDLDQKAVSVARRRLTRLSVPSLRKRVSIIGRNALAPSRGTDIVSHWGRLCSQLGSPGGFDLVVANPPWGASTSAYRSRISPAHFSLLRGQFDTSDLFLELSLLLLRPSGCLAFIIPDSLFQAERTRLRRLLTTRTRIHLIARLGEKLFPGINRACSILICEAGTPTNGFHTACYRLTPALRRRVLNAEVSLADAEVRLGHRVPQRRFAENARCIFDIDVTNAESSLTRRFEALPRRMGDYLNSSRGVELSKAGSVCRCPSCKAWMPTPLRAQARCNNCDAPFSVSEASSEWIVSDTRAPRYLPLLVGESVRRYSLGPLAWLRSAVPGIRYKNPNTYRGPKLLVRKTGVGVSATIDYTNAYTTQVVYIFRLRDHPPKDLTLECLLALLNSRAMYFFLAKQHGETEWRSHPYLTQAQVLALPAPEFTSTDAKRAAASITALVRPTLSSGRPLTARVDALVERHVARLLGLTRGDYRAIYDTLDAVEALLPVRALKNVALTQVFPD